MSARTEAAPAAPVNRPSSRLADLAGQLGGICAWPGLLGILAVQVRLVQPIHAFAAFGLTLALGGLALVLGGFCWIRDRGRADVDLGPARRGTIAGFAVLAIPLIAISPRLGAPRINDVSTDLVDPPVYKISQADQENVRTYMRFPSKFAPIVAEAYPDLQPVLLKVPRSIAYYRARRAAEQMGWEIVGEIAESGILEARARSRFFRFVDDVVVRIRTRGEMSEYSLVDVRSRSRVGRGDLGANANRIRKFLDRL